MEATFGAKLYASEKLEIHSVSRREKRPETRFRKGRGKKFANETVCESAGSYHVFFLFLQVDPISSQKTQSQEPVKCEQKRSHRDLLKTVTRDAHEVKCGLFERDFFLRDELFDIQMGRRVFDSSRANANVFQNARENGALGNCS